MTIFKLSYENIIKKILHTSYKKNLEQRYFMNELLIFQRVLCTVIFAL